MLGWPATLLAVAQPGQGVWGLAAYLQDSRGSPPGWVRQDDLAGWLPGLGWYVCLLWPA